MEINKIYKGDSIEVLKMLPSESIDFIFADPPYYMQTEGELLRTDGTKFNGVCHIRPKGKDGKDKVMLPDGQMIAKQCYWLNREYIAEIVKDMK